NEKVSETIFIEVPDIDNLIKFRDEDPNLNLIKRKIIYSIINKLEIMIKGESDAGKFYILPADNVLSYISTATGYSKKELKDIFDSININPRGESSIASVRIEIDKGDLKFKMPELISKYVRDSRINILIIKELINYLKGKSSSEIYYNKMLTAMTKNLIDNDKIKDLSPLTLSKRLKEISNSISEKTLSDPYELTQIPDENKTITANAANLSKYLNFKKDIEIPVDDKGQLIINFQGYSRSYQNASFGKYLGITRHLPHPATGKTVPFDWFKFKNRSILIGFYTSTGLGKGRDYFETPYDTLYGIEIHANALYTLFERDFIHTLKPIKITENLSFSIDFLVMLAFALIFGFVVPKINILRGFLFSALMALLFIIINVYYVFGKLQIDFPILGTFFSMGFTFLFLTVFKLMTEEKEKKQIKSMFSKYVSPDLVNELTSTSKKLELGGEDRILTVLFSDIRGFTTLSEGLEPQELVNHLNIYLSVMTEIVYKYKGTLDKYIGDAIMAFWGAPIEIPDHALLSCKAALEMMDELDKLNLEWPPAKHIRIGIGLNTGKMTVGNMGSANRMDYTIMGDSVNLGSRVEAVNKTYTTEVIITEFTYDLVKDHVIVRELDMIQVKGKTEPVKIYELLAVND
ncbi:MAG: adenylate/guanylate cyclase domain-containing protein, partial [Spirochaetota bacterium]|nr:adenylate/guanylate cyclase domain-containing protein [Spirochaetota bacterium]